MSDTLRGRIIKGIGGLYIVATEYGNYQCAVRGIFRKENIVPTIGDYVDIQKISEQEMTAIITDIKERKSMLIRPRVSNVDQVVIVFAIVQPSINVDLLDRFIVLAEEQELEISICINKLDLDSAGGHQAIESLYSNIGYKVICTTTKGQVGLDQLKNQLLNKTTVFAGPSGAGKSSLINTIIPTLNLKTGDLSKKISRGKHTTRHTELVTLSEETQNSFVLDSPGFTSLTLDHISKKDLPNYFAEFRPFLGMCQFHDCTHVKETNCAIKSQIGYNICEKRYNMYIKLYNER